MRNLLVAFDVTPGPVPHCPALHPHRKGGTKSAAEIVRKYRKQETMMNEVESPPIVSRTDFDTSHRGLLCCDFCVSGASE